MKQLLSASQIQSRVATLGDQINREYDDRPLTMIGILTGSLIFLADLIRTMDIPCQLGVIQASSYQGQTTTPGELKVHFEILPNLEGRDILLVDDILDTGQTLDRLKRQFESRLQRPVKTAVLLWKKARTTVDLVPDYCGFEIEDHFVVGYGLDYNDNYRHLKSIQFLEPADLKASDVLT